MDEFMAVLTRTGVTAALSVVMQLWICSYLWLSEIDALFQLIHLAEVSSSMAV